MKVRPIPFHPTVQLGGGFGTSEYREWGAIAEAVLGPKCGYFRKWCKNVYGDLWYIRNPDPDEVTRVYEFHSRRGFDLNCCTLGARHTEVFHHLVLTVSLWRDGTPKDYFAVGVVA